MISFPAHSSYSFHLIKLLFVVDGEEKTERRWVDLQLGYSSQKFLFDTVIKLWFLINIVQAWFHFQLSPIFFIWSSCNLLGTERCGELQSGFSAQISMKFPGYSSQIFHEAITHSGLQFIKYHIRAIFSRCSACDAFLYYVIHVLTNERICFLGSNYLRL